MDMGTVTGTDTWTDKGTDTKVDAGENMGTYTEGDKGLNTRPKTGRIFFFFKFFYLARHKITCTTCFHFTPGSLQACLRI